MEEGAKNGWDDKGSARLGAERSERRVGRQAGGRTDRRWRPCRATPPSQEWRRPLSAVPCLRAAHALVSARRTRLPPRGVGARKQLRNAKELARSGGNRTSKEAEARYA